MTAFRGLVSSPFIAAILLFFAGNEKLAKDFLIELHYNSVKIQWSLCGIGVKLANAIFANHERGRLNMKKQTEEIGEKYGFFTDNDEKKRCKIKFYDKKNSMKIEVDDDVETIPYVSPKNEIKKDDVADTIFCASPYNSPKHDIDEKIYVEPKLETIKEIAEKTVKNRMTLLNL